MARARRTTKTAPVARRDEDGVRQFVEHMAMVLNEWGFPRMTGRVLMTLMCTDEDGLTASDLAEQLDVSPAAISGAVRQLMTMGYVVRRAVPGSRRDRYALPEGSWYTASVTKTDFIGHLADVADDATPVLGGTGTPSGARVAEMSEFFRFVQSEMDGLLERWEASRRSGRRPA